MGKVSLVHLLDLESALPDEIRNVACNAVSLTTPAVSRVFFLLAVKFEHTFSTAHEARLFRPLLFICVTLTCPARLRSSTQCCPPNISSITIDHDELFELPVPKGRRVA
jgi:hypothetical protein